MVNVKPIRTEEDYEAALVRIDEIFEAELDSPEGRELDVLVDLVELYENKHVPMGYPDPIEAIKFRMEQAGLSQRDLVPFIGSRARVSEVLSGKRAITMPMARALHEHIGIPADVLIRNSGTGFENPADDIQWSRFPLKTMAKRGWIPDVPDLKERAEEFIRGLMERAGGQDVACAVFYRRNDRRRLNAKTDMYALKAWCWKVLDAANENRPEVDYEPGTVTLDFLSRLAQISWSEKGPRLAAEFLANNGISLVTVRHLPKTYLDGAVLRGDDGRPVIGLTLRYDRVDNFWFCLLHELAHVGLHMDNNEGDAFFDDLSLGGVSSVLQDKMERQADQWVMKALIPKAVWDTSEVSEQPTTAAAVINLAKVLNIHPAIVAGRVRHEQGNYRLLSQFVGTGEIRRQFTLL